MNLDDMIVVTEHYPNDDEPKSYIVESTPDNVFELNSALCDERPFDRNKVLIIMEIKNYYHLRIGD